MLLHLFSRLSVLIDYHNSYGVSFVVLQELTRKIKDNYAILPSDGDQPMWVCVN